MMMVSFAEIFSEVAETETRSIQVLDSKECRLGAYFFIELYCPYVECDCRKVDIIVINEKGEAQCNISLTITKVMKSQ